MHPSLLMVLPVGRLSPFHLTAAATSPALTWDAFISSRIAKALSVGSMRKHSQ